MLRLVRHPLGVRMYVFRRRIHEWHLGLAVLVLGAVASSSDLGLVPCAAWRSQGSGSSPRTGTT